MFASDAPYILFRKTCAVLIHASTGHALLQKAAPAAQSAPPPPVPRSCLRATEGVEHQAL
eukprot:8442308-Prorocentrum_lima.AAC.1